MKNQFSKLFLFAILISTTNCNISRYMSEPEPSGISNNNNLPKTPTPGKCYIRCITPETMKTYEETYPVYTSGEIDASELDTLNLILKPAMARWEYKRSDHNCNSPDPNDCLVLCYVEHPEESQEIIVVKDEEKKDLFEYQTFIFTENVEKGGVAVWEEIDCKLTDYNKLEISFAENGTELTEQDQSQLRGKILKLLRDKPNIRVEISSHTDARGDANFNKDLSQKRAEEVINYLIKNGIQKSRLVAKGYGEDRIKNKCKDGVDCSEQEHAANMRTEFRVLSN